MSFPRDVPELHAQTTNLVGNPGLENAGEGWSGCGEAELIDTQQTDIDDTLAFSGRYAARVGYNLDGVCGNGEAFFDPKGAVFYPIDIPANATTLTVSFRYRRVGTNLFPMQIIVGDSWSCLLYTSDAADE